MGVISRRVVPVCAELACFPCPRLRARSKKPLKRYKKLLNNIYPKSPDLPVNDRAIGKLADYAEQNSDRIFKIVNKLEHHTMKDIRAHQSGYLKADVRVYGKLLSSCKDHMPLFAQSALKVIKDLLDDSDPQLHILGCQMFADFAVNQVDTTYTYEIDKLLPRLVAVTKETGDEKERRAIRAAGLNALACVIWYTTEFSHIPPDFDSLVETVLDNYEAPLDEDAEGRLRKTHPSHHPSSTLSAYLKEEASSAVHKLRENITRMHKAGKPAFLPRDLGYLSKTDLEHPELWAHVCIHGLAKVAMEDVTTGRRVLDPVFRYFDNGHHWGPIPGCLALVFLHDLQEGMHMSGRHTIVSSLVRHLEDPNVTCNQGTQTHIVRIVTSLAKRSQAQSPAGTIAVVAAMSYLFQLLRRSLQWTKPPRGDASISRRETGNVEDHSNLQSAIEECLLYLSKTVRVSRPILDMMAVELESLSGDPLHSQTTMEALTVVGHSIASLEGHGEVQQTFPDNLLLQLLNSMGHPDPTTRIGAHRLLSILLHPPSTTSVCDSDGNKFEREFGGEGIMGSNIGGSRDHSGELVKHGGSGTASSSHLKGRLHNLKMGLERNLSRKVKSHGTVVSLREAEDKVGRLTALQASLLFSSLWLQAFFPSNFPRNFTAMSTTFSLIVTSSASKTESHSVLIRAVQLSLSLFSTALEANSEALISTRRRSMFTFSVALLVQISQVFNLSHMQANIKTILIEAEKDPLLEIREDGILLEKPVFGMSNMGTDDEDLLHISENTAEMLQLILSDMPTLDKEDGSEIASRMLERFEPDDSYMLRPRNFVLPEPMEVVNGDTLFEDPTVFSGDNDLIGSLTPIPTSPSPLDEVEAVPSVDELLGSLNSQVQVEKEEDAIYEPSSINTSDWIRSLAVGEDLTVRENTLPEKESVQLEKTQEVSDSDGQSISKESWESLVLPPASPFDNFLKAAGC